MNKLGSGLVRMQLLSSRLVLREIVREDAPAILEYGLAPENRQYEPFSPPDAASFSNMVEWMIGEQHPMPRTYYYLAIALKEQPALPMGSIHLTIHSHTYGHGEIGYLMGIAYQGRGYATEAAKTLLAFGFDVLGLNRITAEDIIRENVASIRVAEHLGMKCESSCPQAQYFNGRWWDTLTYAIYQSEWQRKQQTT